MGLKLLLCIIVGIACKMLFKRMLLLGLVSNVLAKKVLPQVSILFPKRWLSNLTITCFLKLPLSYKLCLFGSSSWNNVICPIKGPFSFDEGIINCTQNNRGSEGKQNNL